MSPLSPSIDASFEGQIDIEGSALPVVVCFSAGAASLRVGSDTIGSWNFGDIDFLEQEPGVFTVEAEGDSLVFRPEEAERFRSFVVEGPAEDTDNGAGLSESERINGLPTDRSSLQPTEIDNNGPTDTAVDEQALGGKSAAALEALDVGPQAADVDDVDDDLGARSASADNGGLDWSVSPDEFFAAGHNGPSQDELPTPVFNPAASQVDEEPIQTPIDPSGQPAHSAELAEVDGAPESGEVSSSDSLRPDGEERPFHASDLVTATTPEAAAAPTSAEEVADGLDSPGDESAEPSVSRLTALGARLRERRRAGVPSNDSEPPTSKRVSIAERLGSSPAPSSDSENLKQWAVVVGGGLLVVAVLATIVWVAFSMLGSGEETTADTTVPSAPDAIGGPAPTTPPSTVPPTTTTAVETTAEASQFLAEWNQLATTYASSLAIETPVDGLPLSASATPTIQLEYGADQSLTLLAAPQHNGSDREILVAMGIAIAWAEPNVDPEGRRAVLGALGIDVDNPQLGEIGGELARDRWIYSAALADGVIRFTVAPAT